MSAAGDSTPLSRRWRLVPVAVVFGVVMLDVLTKVWAVDALSDGPISIIGDDVDFRLARNPGGAFSLFTNATPILATLAIGLTIALIIAVRRARDPWMIVALSLVLGGAMGNIMDRIFRSPGFLRGHVVDFVRVGWFPSFNVADSAVTIGAVMLVILSFRRAPSDAAAEVPEPGESA